MKRFIRNILLGDTAVTEYSTVTIQNEILEKVFLADDSKTWDISKTHWLLCLNPIIFGVWFESTEGVLYSDKTNLYKMFFHDSASNNRHVAALELELFSALNEQEGTLVLFKLRKVNIFHVNRLKTSILFHKYYKKPEQNFFKLKSYASAYSYPRRVRLVSFREDNWFNIFPMDLVGDIPGSKRYVFGLRHTNVTLPRIIRTGKMVISEIPYEFKEMVYQLGKHHKQPLSDLQPPFETFKSELFGFPIPVWANSYKEINIHRTLNLGSHMLLWGEEVNERKINTPTSHLYHIHFLHFLHQKNMGLSYQLV
jgi:hypothetical protein